MSEEKHPSRHVAFAERFASGSFSDFNAFAALKRARLLLREARQIAEIFELEEKREDPAMWSRHGLEVVPYTLVGYVTCLEWHARSRIMDLYSYRPDSIDSKVLERKVPGRILSQMIRANVSVPQFLGASITIGSTGDYLAVFDELFKTLDINRKPADVITSRGGRPNWTLRRSHPRAVDLGATRGAVHVPSRAGARARPRRRSGAYAL